MNKACRKPDFNVFRTFSRCGSVVTTGSWRKKACSYWFKGEWESKVRWYSVQSCMYLAYATVLNTAINGTCDLNGFPLMGRENIEQRNIKKIV